MEEALKTAIENAGGVKALGDKLGISHQAIIQWKICPPMRVLAVEAATGVRREQLRPDMYPANERAAPDAADRVEAAE